ncbi:type VI secretion system-associated protein TagF [Massilia sp. PWRC2]|uniref:type VI secretion system-associated protein TagF n=1 Tax=Massilia sp. PWRC2 TaxID=2804626 RepID=UPI003CF508E1
MNAAHGAAGARERLGYFGKLPACSDFIKLAPDAELMGVLDDWLAQVMTRLPNDPRWKLHYDAMAPVSFAFVGPRRRHAIAGHVVGSHDQSGRRFPFLLMRTIAVQVPTTFVSHCPLVLAPLFQLLMTRTQTIIAAADPHKGLHELAERAPGLEQDASASLDHFLADATLASLAASLQRRDSGRLVLALGMLLQPLLHGGAADLEKSLLLPLPRALEQRAAVAAFWMELIAPFLRRADLDLALFFTEQEGNPVLVVGFCDACVAALHAIIDPMVGRHQQVSLADTGWVDEHLGADVDVRALASHLDQPALSLRLARELFLATFLGAAK